MIVVATCVEFVDPGRRGVHGNAKNKISVQTLAAREQPQWHCANGKTRIVASQRTPGRTGCLSACWRAEQNEPKPNREEACVNDY